MSCLDVDKKISWENLDRYKHDNKFSLIRDSINFYKKYFLMISLKIRLIAAQNFLKNWNLGTDNENIHAAFGVCIVAPEWLAEIKKESQPDPIKIFKDCVDEFEKNFNQLDVKWSEISFLERGNKILPVQGGPDVLRAIYSPRSEDGILKAVAGDGLYI